MKKFFLFPVFLLFLQASTYASPAFPLISGDKGASVYYQGKEPVVETAIDMLVGDSKLVCAQPFTRVNALDGRTIIVGIPDREPQLRELLSRYNIAYIDLSGRWEAFRITSAHADGNNYLFVLGSDPRGTAYGVLELSRQMGVTPWVWWADVTPQKQSEVNFTADNQIHAPSVQYRGIFLNDEDWALMPWSSRTFEPTTVKGRIGPRTYARICELLLRLRANTLWPAMHECTLPFYFAPGNKEAAHKYGIVMGTSHCEPLMRTNTGEWDSKKYGPYNYLTNRERVLSYWDERLKEVSETENIFTLGMRGVHDGRMQGVSSLDDETRVLRDVIKEQRELLTANGNGKKIQDIPQVFIPYKEVLKAYDNGLELPEDVTLVWCDDNHGHIMRLSNEQEQKRSGGAGVYYHISYWGKPHDYLWLASTQPGLIYAEMKRAWDNGARKLWIVNVGDIKPGEYLTEFFLDMAWDVNAINGNNIHAHRQNWLNKTFAGADTPKIDRIMEQYYRLAAQRKPEHMGWNRVEVQELRAKGVRGGLEPVQDTELSPHAFGDEMERRIRAYDEIADLSREVYSRSVPRQLKDAYFQLVHYPVVASGAMNRKILYAQKSRMYATQNPELAGAYARLATDAYNEIAALDYTYNKDIMNGKWELMMDMNPRNLPVFEKPVLPALDAQYTSRYKSIPAIPAGSNLTAIAGTPVESDRMIALNASAYINKIDLEKIQALGHSGSAVRLPAARKINTKQPHLEYKVTTTSSGPVKIKVGTIPMHPVHGTSDMRYAIVIDNQKPLIVSSRADFLSDTWAKAALRNQMLTVTDATLEKPGEHTIRIYALDEELFFDQLMLEFDMERKHYLIPTGQ